MWAITQEKAMARPNAVFEMTVDKVKNDVMLQAPVASGVTFAASEEVVALLGRYREEVMSI